MLPCCVAVSDHSLPVDLQVSCAVALTPPSPSTGARGRKMSADKSLTHVQVRANRIKDRGRCIANVPLNLPIEANPS